jgi:hypothetical protein
LTYFVPEDNFILQVRVQKAIKSPPQSDRESTLFLREVVMQKVIISYRVLLFVILASLPGSVTLGGDWPEWRGPSRDGTSQEKGLPTKWTMAGENLVWKQPYGGRSAPIIMGGRVFIFNSAGEGETMQERVMAFDANTGKLLWEHRMNLRI